MEEMYETEDSEFVRPRAYTWSHPQKAAWSSRADDGECVFDDDEDRTVPAKQYSPQIQTGNGKKRRKSYTEIIATAILSSAEKRLTLAEIYDWMASNVEEYKNQRYVPSSSSWKNAVRHNLSVQSCFKRVKRHGVEKPSWWTVDMRQAAKRRLSISIPEDKSVAREVQKSVTIAPIAEEQIKEADLYFSNLLESGGIDESGEHTYSRAIQLSAVTGDGNKVEFDSMVTYDTKGDFSLQQTTTTLTNLDEQQQLRTSTEQLTQAWIDQFKVPSQIAAPAKDGSTVQTLRVKTVHGVEQNVRFMGPLRLNVVLRCDRASQTDDSDRKPDFSSQTEILNSGYAFEPTFSRACSIEQTIEQSTLMNLGSEAICDMSKVMHGDVKMPMTLTNVLSPSILDDEAMACWNSANFNTDDMLNFVGAT